jgi:hypothetical protein
MTEEVTSWIGVGMLLFMLYVTVDFHFTMKKNARREREIADEEYRHGMEWALSPRKKLDS